MTAVACPNDYCHPDWPNKRPSEWTEEERRHVWLLVHGGIDCEEDAP